MSASIQISIGIGESACFSSSCTQVLEEKGSLLIDRDRFVIEGTSYFVLRDISKPNSSCTADCGGGGSLAFEIDDLAAGTYTVYMDKQPFGHVTLPLHWPASVCLNGPLTQAEEYSLQSEPVPQLSVDEFSPVATTVSDRSHVPTPTFTPIPRPPMIPTETKIPTATPFPTPEIIYSSPACSIDNEQVTCTDDLLHITYKYPPAWGRITTSLQKGYFAGYEYAYEFIEPETDRRTIAIAGGLSANYGTQRGGTILDFRGFSRISTEEFCQPPFFAPLYYSPICNEVKPGIVLRVSFPDDKAICDFFTSYHSYPLGSVYIDLPLPRIINGFVFHIKVLSEEQEEELYSLLGDIEEHENYPIAIRPPTDCSPEARNAFNLKRLVMIKEMQRGIMDAGTAENIQALYDLAESIEGPGLP